MVGTKLSTIFKQENVPARDWKQLKTNKFLLFQSIESI